jgi:hypothetical protein
MNGDVTWALWIQLITTLPLCGVIWMVQLVVYPQFANVGAAEFSNYHRFHSGRITFIVAPLMLGELIGAVAMVTQISSGDREGLKILGLILAISAWLLTGLFAVPAHNELSRGFSVGAHHRLMRANTARTAVWSARCVLVVFWMLTIQGRPR